MKVKCVECRGEVLSAKFWLQIAGILMIFGIGLIQGIAIGLVMSKGGF